MGEVRRHLDCGDGAAVGHDGSGSAACSAAATNQMVRCQRVFGRVSSCSGIL